MDEIKKNIVILHAEDDEEDHMLLQDAFAENNISNQIHHVSDGEELLMFLKGEGDYHAAPKPGLILLDLNMPKKDGRECLAEIKADDKLKMIPIVVLTTSKTEDDIVRSYSLGVNSFIRKPVTFQSLVNIVKMLGKYWFETVELPSSVE